MGRRLREARLKIDISQKEAAEKVGISNVTLSQYEKGTRNPDPNTLAKLANLYGVSTDWLLGGQFQSTRRGFGRDHGNNSKATKKYLDLQLFSTLKGLPEIVCNELQSPLLFYKVLQLRDDVPISISESYLPSSLPQKELKKILEGVKQDPTLSLYKTLGDFGRKPINCKEIIVIDKPSPEECELLQMPDDVPVARIVRKTFDASSHLVELCLLTSRTDLYNFTYEFTL